GRDPERTPMPWDNSALCGFTTGEPWLPIGDANRAVSVEASKKDRDSMLALYQRLLGLRRAQPVLVSGQLTDLRVSEGVLQFIRSDGRKRFRVAVNLTDEARQIDSEKGVIATGTDLLRESQIVSDGLELRPAE